MNPFLKALSGKRPETIPVWFMRQAGRFLPEYREIRAKTKDFFELCRNVELSVKITALPVKLLGVDAAILFSDLLVPLLPLKSMKVSLKESVGPVIEVEKPPTKPEDLLHDFDVEEELGFVGEIVKGFKEEYPNVPLIGFCGAPFTLLSYILEGGSSKSYHRTKSFMYRENEAFHSLCHRLVSILTRYVRMQKESGIDAIQIFDSWAGALSPEDYEKTIFPHTKRLIEGSKKFGIPVIYFSTGTCGCLKKIREYPCEAVSVDWRIRLEDAIFVLEDKVVQGNLDPSALQLDKEALRERVMDILRQGRKAKAHIFNLGHGIFPDTDPDKVKWLVDLVHSTVME